MHSMMLRSGDMKRELQMGGNYEIIALNFVSNSYQYHPLHPKPRATLL